MNVELLTSDFETPECNIAINLKSQFESWLSPRISKDDWIFIAPNIRLYGETIRDLDILIFGILDKGVSLPLNILNDDKTPIKTNVYISSFCFAIDIRDEISENVLQVGKEIWLESNGRSANFSAYNQSLYSSLRKFFLYYFKDNNSIPFICTCLNFKNIVSSNISNVYPNFIRGELTLHKLFQSFAYISKPHKMSPSTGSYYLLNSIFSNRDKQSYIKFKSVVSAFSTILNNVGPLTKIKLDAFSKSRKDLPPYYDSLGKELIILKGGAGTGKTLKILNIAKELYDGGKRCLILTYNRALVSDIRRLLDLNKINSEPLIHTIEIRTIHSFLNPILDEIMHWKDTYNANSDAGPINDKSTIYFLSFYNDILKSSAENLKNFTIGLSSKLYSHSKSVISNYDFILIDEAQDWQKEERDILYHLFGSHKLIIADGLQQLIRTNNPLNWKVSNNKQVQCKEIVFPKKSLRQNEKLCHLQSYFAQKFSVPWDVVKNDALSKGSIYVYVGEMNFQIAGFLKDFTKNYSVDKYDDLLFLAPPRMVSKSISSSVLKMNDLSHSVEVIQKRSFKFTSEWKKLGLNLFDMTHVDISSSSQPSSGEYRLINYESCRGLESYGVVALEMDTFFDNKIKYYKAEEESIKQGDIFVQSHESKALRYAAMWSLIVFSRPVELLLITIKDINSLFFKSLMEIKAKNENLINIIK